MLFYAMPVVAVLFRRRIGGAGYRHDIFVSRGAALLRHAAIL